MGTDFSSEQSKRHGFSLVESAIVLAVVGLVLGGIWVASTAVIQRYRVNETASGIVKVATEARQLFTYASYPTINKWDDVTSTIAAAGILPKNFECCSGHYAKTPMGVYFSSTLLCYDPGSACPAFSIGVGYPYNNYNYKKYTVKMADCITLLHQVGGIAKNDLIAIQLVNFDSGINIWMPIGTINFETITCPVNTNLIIFYFKP